MKTLILLATLLISACYIPSGYGVVRSVRVLHGVDYCPHGTRMVVKDKGAIIYCCEPKEKKKEVKCEFERK